MTTPFAWTNDRIRRTLPIACLAIVVAFAGHVLASERSHTMDEKALVVTPDRVDLHLVPWGENNILEFGIENQTDKEIRLTYIFAECDCSFVMPHDGVVPAHGKFILQAEIPIAEMEGERLVEMITILTDHSVQREIFIPIYLSFQPENEPRKPRADEG